jgi:hypothetical protein
MDHSDRSDHRLHYRCTGIAARARVGLPGSCAADAGPPSGRRCGCGCDGAIAAMTRPSTTGPAPLDRPGGAPAIVDIKCCVSPTAPLVLCCATLRSGSSATLLLLLAPVRVRVRVCVRGVCEGVGRWVVGIRSAPLPATPPLPPPLVAAGRCRTCGGGRPDDEGTPGARGTVASAALAPLLLVPVCGVQMGGGPLNPTGFTTSTPKTLNRTHHCRRRHLRRCRWRPSQFSVADAACREGIPRLPRRLRVAEQETTRLCVGSQ